MTTFFSNIKKISIHDKNKAQIEYEKRQARNKKKREWCQKNREEYNKRQREYKKVWRKENFEHIRYQHKQWRDKNPIKNRNNWKKRNKKMAEKIQCPLCLKLVNRHTFKYGTHKNYDKCRVATWIRVINKKIEN
tara:strand:+ start:6942 stop:7343 length:402 start_codon:yes stop_codon:yes gene_type:complete